MTGIGQSGRPSSKKNARPKSVGPWTTDAGKTRYFRPCGSDAESSRVETGLAPSPPDAEAAPSRVSTGVSRVPRKPSDIFSLSRRWSHVPQRALWSDSGKQRAQHDPLARRDQESHDRQAPEADRAGCEEESPGTLPAGTFLWSLFLRGAGHSLVRPHRARS